MELTVVLAGIPVRLSLRSPAYAACFQPFWTEADPVAAVRIPEDALKEAAPHYEAGTTPEQVEYLELGPRVCDALLPYGRILFCSTVLPFSGAGAYGFLPQTAGPVRQRSTCSGSCASAAK